MMTPDQLLPPSFLPGNRPTRLVTASMTVRGISRASLIHAPVSSSDSSFFMSFGLSSETNTSSSSTSPTFTKPVIGASNRIVVIGPNQSSQVLIVVLFSSAYVFLITAHRLRRTVSFPTRWRCARDMMSVQQPTDLPEPIGPRMPLTNASDAWNLASVALALYVTLRASPSAITSASPDRRPCSARC